MMMVFRGSGRECARGAAVTTGQLGLGASRAATASAGMMTTTRSISCRTACETLPSMPRIGPKPREPMTISSASRAIGCDRPELRVDSARAARSCYATSRRPIAVKSFLIAYRRACLSAIAYLQKFGYSSEQAYLLLGAAPIEGRFSGVVDIPNSCATLYLPTAIFDFDIRPSADGPQRADRGSCAVTS